MDEQTDKANYDSFQSEEVDLGGKVLERVEAFEEDCELLPTITSEEEEEKIWIVRD